MKTNHLQGILLGILIVSICSCATQDDSIKNDNAPPQAVKKNASISCEDLLNAPEDFEGKTITLSAISWGSQESIEGDEILMSIDDNKLKGLQQAHVLVHFSKDQKSEIEHIKEDDPVNLTATVGAYEFGALRLIDAKVNRKKK